METTREYIIELENYQIAVVEFGHGQRTPVIALHGWLDNAASFELIGHQLSQSKLIAIDLVGHGYSSQRPKAMPYHIWDNVSDLHELIEKMGFNRVHLIGHSMGASIAMLYAATFPERVSELMAIEGLVPLMTSSASVVQQFSAAQVKRTKMANRAGKRFFTYEGALDARVNGRWPVSESAAKCLLVRGLKENPEGITWRHDPRLLMPSLVRFCPEQIHAFLRAVKSKCTVIKAHEGASELIDGWIDELNKSDLIEIPGGHHAHMELPGAKVIADIIEAWE